jgi:predicted TIM-barrel fold metal-dependent hydrolase
MRAVKAQLKQHRSDIVAFKCYIGYHGRPEDPGYQPFYELAIEESLPVIFHTGDFGGTGILEDAHPLRIDAIAGKYPSMRIVMAHMGNPWVMEAALVVDGHENVWADLSALHWGNPEELGAMLEAGELKSIKQGLLMSNWNEAMAVYGRYDRLLYGTDVPPPWAIYRRFIEALIPKEHHVKVFRKNAEDLFGVKVVS